MRTPKEEREIHAGGYVYDENGMKATRMEVYTSDYGYMLKFDRFCAENPEEWKLERVETSGGDVVAKHYSCPTSCISFRRGRNKISEAGKQSMKDSLDRARRESPTDRG